MTLEEWMDYAVQNWDRAFEVKAYDNNIDPTQYLIYNRRERTYHYNADGKLWFNYDKTTAEKVAVAMYLHAEQEIEKILLGGSIERTGDD